MPANVLTDRAIAELYFGLAQHYKHCKDRNLSIPDIYNELANGVYFTLYNPLSTSPLKSLPDSEKIKVYNVLNTFFYATPEYHQVPVRYQGQNFFNNGQVPPIRIVEHHHYHTYYRRNDDFLLNWILINQLTSRPYHYGHHHHHDGCCWGGGSRSGSSDDSKRNSEAFFYLLLLMLAAIVAACAFIAAYYLFSSFCDGLERVLCSEGALQGLMSVLSMAVTTLASTWLSGVLAGNAIYSLAVAAGVSNPVGWVFFCVIGLGLVGGALGHFVSEQVQNYIVKQNNLESIDPQDPHRFTLTDSEANSLQAKGIDPIKVKCAIVALRAELGDKPVPSFLNRLFSDTKTQETLSLIRQLRSGAISEVVVGDMHFNCKFNALAVPVQQSYSSQPIMGQPVYDNRPTAPIMEQEGYGEPPPYEQYQYLYPRLQSVPNEPPPSYHFQ